jgi:hypothetical protein
MATALHFHEQAVFLRESSGSTDIEKTLRKAVAALARFDIPHLVCGGFAVQEYGYPRFTSDVDIIVPDVAVARERLSLTGFRETKVEIDLLPGGNKVDSGPLTLPVPTVVSPEPQFLTLEKLISAKLSTYMGRGIQRVQDYADVVKLVAANQLPRDFGVASEVRPLYETLWDEMNSDANSA